MCTNDIKLFYNFLTSILQLSSFNKKLPTPAAKRKLALLQLRKFLQIRKIDANRNVAANKDLL